jgi:hypothetical protein
MAETIPMPMFQTFLGELNCHFSKDRINVFATERREHFAAGKPLDLAFLVEAGTPVHRAWNNYIAQTPQSFRETLRSIIQHALSTTPPTPITFAWAPGYDYELTLWQAPDTELTRGGITVLLRSRYPDDRHPLQKGAAAS